MKSLHFKQLQKDFRSLLTIIKQVRKNGDELSTEIMKCLVQTLPAEVQLIFWHLKQREEIVTQQQTAAISKKEYMKENAGWKQCTIGNDNKKRKKKM